MNSFLINAIGVAAALCSMTSFTPQLLKLWRERDAGAVSLRMYVVTVTGFSLWTVYGVLLKSWPLVGSNLVSLGLSAAILALKLKFDSTPKRMEGGARPPGPEGVEAPRAEAP